MTRSLLIAATAACLLPVGVSAQRGDAVLLTPTKAFSAEPFSRVRGVQELSDGRVLVADQTEEALYLVDFDAETRQMIGRRGEGPEEYGAPTGLYPLAGDTVLLIDISNSRVSVVGPDGSISRTFPLFGGDRQIPDGSDLAGNHYWDRVTSVRLAKREDPSADQAPIERFNGATSTVDTIAYLTVPGPSNPNAFPAWDRWDVATDGWVAILRNQDDYRVDWVGPDGTTRTGPVIDDRPLRVNNADRQALAERPGGGAGGAMVMGGGQARRPPPPDIPDFFPPGQRIWTTWDGRALVERYEHLSEERLLLDVFDRTGTRTARVRLPEGRRVVGFGRSGLIAVNEDELGFLWLEIYAIP